LAASGSPVFQWALVASRALRPAAVNLSLFGVSVTSSSWTRSGSTMTLRVVVPPNATALVRVAATSVPPEAVPQGPGVYTLPSGSYTFTATV